MISFGSRASAVKIKIPDLFKTTPKTKSVPTFTNLLKYTTKEDILQAPVTSTSISIDFYALLPPCLSEELFIDDNMVPCSIFLKFVRKINFLHSSNSNQIPNTQPETTQQDDGDSPDVKKQYSTSNCQQYRKPNKSSRTSTKSEPTRLPRNLHSQHQ